MAKMLQQLALPAVKTKGSPLEVISRFWAWLFLLLLLLFFSLTGPGFFSLLNLQSIVNDMALALLMSLGQTFVIIAAGIDLSTGFTMGLAAVIEAVVLNALVGRLPLGLGLALPLSILIALGVGTLPGLVNGILIGRLRVPPFIATLGMYGIARGLGFIFSGGGQPVSVQIPGVGDIGNGYLLYYHPAVGFSFFHAPTLPPGARPRDLISILPFPLIVAIVAFVLCHWLLSRTRFGRHTYALGGAPEAARRAGIPVARQTLKIYMLSAFLASVAGVLYVLRFTNGDANAGDPLLLDSIAAVVIGGASLFGGEGTLVGTLIGTLIIYVIQNGLVIIGIDPYWQFVAIGAVIILAVMMDQAKARVLNR
ncbi:ABC transporter permease [Thermogemmatispora sp.]|uniref:ABC transporter permease n=1 Tax=Thermogemmatispora sp. TaxID=1968838 RepID=UPI00262FC7C4|nr:ABC transporter permease [Thermogemmatispora sp.]